MAPRHLLKHRRRLSDETVHLIEQARRDLQFGAMRTRIWLERVHHIRVATATIRRICQDLGYAPVRRTEPRRSRHPILCRKEHPSDCVQVDVKEVPVAGQKCFQYTAIDDCTRYRFLHLYPRKYHGTSLDFLATVRQILPFPIRKVQVDTVLYAESKHAVRTDLPCAIGTATLHESAHTPHGLPRGVRRCITIVMQGPRSGLDRTPHSRQPQWKLRALSTRSVAASTAHANGVLHWEGVPQSTVDNQSPS